MKKIWNWVIEHPNRTMFLVPILLVAGISISHVVSWYNLANPISWAIYLSIAIEIGAMTALVAATNKIKGGVWIMFAIITIIQMIGNIFFSYKEINSDGELFKAWVELTAPLWDSIGSDSTDVIAMKRWLAFLEGGLLPIISLTSLHFFVKYDNGQTNEVEQTPVKPELIVEDEEHMMNKDSVNNPTFEISKIISGYKESNEMNTEESLVDESQYLDLQEVEKKKSKELNEVDGLGDSDLTSFEMSKTEENLDELEVSLDELLDDVVDNDTENEVFSSKTEENLDELEVSLDEHLAEGGQETDTLSDSIRGILEDDEMIDEDWTDWDESNIEPEELVDEIVSPIDNEQLFWENVEPSTEKKNEEYNPYEEVKRLSYIKK